MRKTNTTPSLFILYEMSKDQTDIFLTSYKNMNEKNGVLIRLSNQGQSSVTQGRIHSPGALVVCFHGGCLIANNNQGWMQPDNSIKQLRFGLKQDEKGKKYWVSIGPGDSLNTEQLKKMGFYVDQDDINEHLAVLIEQLATGIKIKNGDGTEVWLALDLSKLIPSEEGNKLINPNSWNGTGYTCRVSNNGNITIEYNKIEAENNYLSEKEINQKQGISKQAINNENSGDETLATELEKFFVELSDLCADTSDDGTTIVGYPQWFITGKFDQVIARKNETKDRVEYFKNNIALLYCEIQLENDIRTAKKLNYKDYLPELSTPETRAEFKKKFEREVSALIFKQTNVKKNIKPLKRSSNEKNKTSPDSPLDRKSEVSPKNSGDLKKVAAKTISPSYPLMQNIAKDMVKNIPAAHLISQNSAWHPLKKEIEILQAHINKSNQKQADVLQNAIDTIFKKLNIDSNSYQLTSLTPEQLKTNYYDSVMAQVQQWPKLVEERISLIKQVDFFVSHYKTTLLSSKSFTDLLNYYNSIRNSLENSSLMQFQEIKHKCCLHFLALYCEFTSIDKTGIDNLLLKETVSESELTAMIKSIGLGAPFISPPKIVLAREESKLKSTEKTLNVQSGATIGKNFIQNMITKLDSLIVEKNQSSAQVTVQNTQIVGQQPTFVPINKKKLQQSVEQEKPLVQSNDVQQVVKQQSFLDVHNQKEQQKLDSPTSPTQNWQKHSRDILGNTGQQMRGGEILASTRVERFPKQPSQAPNISQNPIVSSQPPLQQPIFTPRKDTNSNHQPLPVRGGNPAMFQPPTKPIQQSQNLNANPAPKRSLPIPNAPKPQLPKQQSPNVNISNVPLSNAPQLSTTASQGLQRNRFAVGRGGPTDVRTFLQNMLDITSKDGFQVSTHVTFSAEIDTLWFKLKNTGSSDDANELKRLAAALNTSLRSKYVENLTNFNQFLQTQISKLAPSQPEGPSQPEITQYK